MKPKWHASAPLSGWRSKTSPYHSRNQSHILNVEAYCHAEGSAHGAEMLGGSKSVLLWMKMNYR
jgi:hypothetical protein